ncbi:coiled-coil domain-containing protein [Streptomyces sp. NPDC018833]|uniref:coiled-coil domain-containing protein n=1 Tax=Streptomyces sp. NPDC018833 TaxID=3365053 RepID=UPI0037BD7FF7
MSGRMLRTVCAVALVAATAVAGDPAAADPVPGGTPGAVAPAPGGERGREAGGAVDRVLGDLGDGVVEALVGDGGPTAGAGAPVGLQGVLTHLGALYRQASEAEKTYRVTARALTKQRAETARLGRELGAARRALAVSRADAGWIARQQYQGTSELSAYLRLLLAPDPEQALEQGHLIERVATGRLAAMSRLEAVERRARELATASRAALDTELALAAGQQHSQATTTARLKSAAAVLATLSPEDVAALGSLPKAPRPLPGGGAAGTGGTSRTDGTAGSVPPATPATPAPPE